MFFLWVNNIKIKKINKSDDILKLVFAFVSVKSETIPRWGKAVSLINKTTKTVKEENIEDTEEYLNINETTIHVKINRKLNCNDKANNTPRYVATPFPPLNFNQIGKIWPKKVIKADNWINSGLYSFVIITGA